MYRLLQWLDQYTEGIQSFLQAHEVLAPLLLLLVEEMGIPIIVPGDGVIAYVGYGLTKHPSVTLWQALIAALIAVLLGSTILFFVARRWGRQIINKLGKFIFLKQSHIDRAEASFKRYGIWAIIFGRHIPGMRVPITIFAATSGVRYRTFISCTFISTVLWIFVYLKLGTYIGQSLQTIFRRDALVTIIVFVGIVMLILAMHLYGKIKRRK